MTTHSYQLAQENSLRSYTFRAVFVPDFSGESTAMFEARTLFFLASWIEASVHSRMPDLTLACIGNPPLRVVRLAEQAGAHVEIGARAARGSTANKLRGFKVAGHEDPILLLDADILILGSLRELEDLPEDYAVARASRGIITERYWIEIYGGMGLTVPAAMIMPVEGSEGAPAQPMFPYFNGGVVYSKRNASLAQTWEDISAGCSSVTLVTNTHGGLFAIQIRLVSPPRSTNYAWAAVILFRCCPIAST